jgi:hypothetical protein
LIANKTVVEISRTGEVHDVWSFLRPVLTLRLSKALESEFSDFDLHSQEYQDLYQLIVKRLNTFLNPPFTIQRLCELLAYPKMHYSRADKYLRALEKVLMVVSVMEPTSRSVVHKSQEEKDDSRDLAESGLKEDEEGMVSERKRPLPLTVELQEADSTMEDSMDVSEHQEEGPAKKAKLEPSSEERVGELGDKLVSTDGEIVFRDRPVPVTKGSVPESVMDPSLVSPQDGLLGFDEKEHQNTNYSNFDYSSRGTHLAPSQDSRLDTAQDLCLDTSRNSSLDTPHDSCLDTPQDLHLDTSQELSLDTTRNSIPDTPQDSCLDPPQDLHLDVPQGSQDTNQDLRLDTSEDAHQDTPQDPCLDSSRDSHLNTSDDSRLGTPQDMPQGANVDKLSESSYPPSEAPPLDSCTHPPHGEAMDTNS